MKTYGYILGALLVCGAIMAQAAQDTDITPREVKNPKTLETYLEANASDTQTRVASLEGTIGTNTAANLVTVGAISVTGAVTIAEGKLADSTVLSADVKDGELVNADVNASAAIAVTKLGVGGLIPANSAASLTNIPGANVTGNVPGAAVSNGISTISGVYLTNTCLAADGKTNTYIFAPVGSRYVLDSITTSP